MTQLLVALAVGLGAAMQALTGFGFGLVASPFLVAALGPVVGISTSIVLASILNLAMLAPQVRHARPSLIWLVLIFSSLAAWITGRLVSEAATAPVTIVAGLVTISAAILLWVRPSNIASGKPWQAVAGTLSGIMNSVAGVGGPPVVLHAAAADWPRLITVPTLQLYFLVTNASTLLGLHQFPSIRLTMLGAMAVGLASGALLRGKLSDSVARATTLMLAALGGAAAIAQGLIQ